MEHPTGSQAIVEIEKEKEIHRCSLGDRTSTLRMGHGDGSQERSPRRINHSHYARQMEGTRRVVTSREMYVVRDSNSGQGWLILMSSLEKEFGNSKQ